MNSTEHPYKENSSRDHGDFIRESRIETAVSTPFWKKLVLTILLALVFGVIAGATALFSGSRLSTIFTSAPTTETIKFSSDEDPRSTTVATFPDETEAADTTEEGTTEETAETPADHSEDPTAEGASQEPDLASVVRDILSTTSTSLPRLKELSAAAEDVIRTASRALVTVTATNPSKDWLEQDYSTDTSTFGVIVGITSLEVLILTPADQIAELSENSSLTVSFGSTAVTGAYIKGSDAISGLSVLAVNISQLTAATLRSIDAIVLGNSYSCRAGQTILALGAPNGHVGSLDLGILTYVDEDVASPDNSLSLFYTSIPADEAATGFLINASGELIAWIDPTLQNGSKLWAVGISSLKKYIENLSNGIPIGYLGVEGINITQSLILEYDLPRNGFLVTNCLDKGPALAAGLQSGDIIIDLAGKNITGVSTLRGSLLEINTPQTIKATILRLSDGVYRELTFDIRIDVR